MAGINSDLTPAQATNNAQATTDQLYKPVTDFVSKMPGNFNDFWGSQFGHMNDFLGRYTGAIQGQEGLPSIYERTGRELNLPALRENANTLNTYQQNIPFTYGAASRGVDVNANQLSQIIGRKNYEIAPSVTSANNALSTAEGVQGQMVGANQAQQQKQLLPFQAEQSILPGVLASRATGYDNSTKAQLDALINKAQSGVGLTTSELQMANSLAQIETQYQKMLDNWKAKVSYTGQVGLAGLLGLAGGA